MARFMLYDTATSSITPPPTVTSAAGNVVANLMAIRTAFIYERYKVRQQVEDRLRA